MQWQFEYKLKVLQEIESAWRQEKEVTVKKLDNESSSMKGK